MVQDWAINSSCVTKIQNFKSEIYTTGKAGKKCYKQKNGTRLLLDQKGTHYCKEGDKCATFSIQMMAQAIQLGKKIEVETSHQQSDDNPRDIDAYFDESCKIPVW